MLREFIHRLLDDKGDLLIACAAGEGVGQNAARGNAEYSEKQFRGRSFSKGGGRTGRRERERVKRK